MSAIMIVVATLAASPQAYATVVRYLSLELHIAKADAIVRGKVSAQRVYMDKAQGTIVTDTTLTISSTYWGKAAKRVTLQQWGGQLDDRAEIISGDATFTKGEEVIVFLKRDAKGKAVHYLVAMAQSKYSVQRRGTSATVKRDLSDLAFIAPDGKTITPLKENPLSLASFEAELVTLIAGIKGAGR